MSTAAPNVAAKNNPYQISRPAGRCAVSGQTIEPGQQFMAALRQTPAGLERVDVSVEQWPAFDRRDTLAFWQTVMPRGETKRKLLVDDSVLCELFHRLADATEPAKLNFRFVLGLILMRKRLLVYEGTRTESDREIWTMRQRGREDKLDLLNPRLDESQVAEVSGQLDEILNQEM